MNNPQKIIWSFYLLLIIIGIFAWTSGGYNPANILMTTLVFGWIPFLIAHIIWRDRTKLKLNISNNQSQPHKPTKDDNSQDKGKSNTKSYMDEPFKRFLLAIFCAVLFFGILMFVTLIFVRVFIVVDTERSWGMAFLLMPIPGSFVLGTLAYIKRCNWKKILVYMLLGLATTKETSFLSVIAFYYLLGENTNEKIQA